MTKRWPSSVDDARAAPSTSSTIRKRNPPANRAAELHELSGKLQENDPGQWRRHRASRSVALLTQKSFLQKKSGFWLRRHKKGREPSEALFRDWLLNRLVGD